MMNFTPIYYELYSILTSSNGETTHVMGFLDLQDNSNAASVFTVISLVEYSISGAPKYVAFVRS